MSGLLVAGTTSDAGKSVLTTGLCRAFARRGVKVAPFKAQNMSNNSMVVRELAGFEARFARTSTNDPAVEMGELAGFEARFARTSTNDPTVEMGELAGFEARFARTSTNDPTVEMGELAGFEARFPRTSTNDPAVEVRGTSLETPGFGEIGRAQWVQALAALATPEPAMNPVLLKPGSDRRSHVVLLGQPAGSVSSTDWEAGRRHLASAAHAAFDDLASRYDVVVAEGAGSPAEINLRAGDYVNMGLARHASLPTIVVGDIDRGGVFAALLGTVALLSAEDQALVAGFVMNKFRGDLALLAPGLGMLQRATGRPTFGVLPWDPSLWLDSEDALDLAGRRSSAEVGATKRVAVVRLPRISNFTDLDALGLEPDLDVVFASSPRDLADADLIVLPGTRATIDDLAWLRSRGLDRAVIAHASAGRPVLGICGGCQMLGRTISDPAGVEGPAGATVAGLGLLDLTTEFSAQKVLRLHSPVGYEIHHGRVSGSLASGAVSGTMIHGRLEDDAYRASYLREALDVAAQASFATAREARLDLLGDLVEQHLDVDALLSLAMSGAPAALPVLPPGGVL